MPSFGRLRLGLTIAGLALASALPGATFANDNPDFYGTIVAVARDRGTISVMPTKDQLIVVDVRHLGSTPWDQGDFRVDQIILIRTQRVDGGLVATGWEAARTGSFDTAFEGIEERRDEQDEDDDKDRERGKDKK